MHCSSVAPGGSQDGIVEEAISRRCWGRGRAVMSLCMGSRRLKGLGGGDGGLASSSAANAAAAAAAVAAASASALAAAAAAAAALTATATSLQEGRGANDGPAVAPSAQPVALGKAARDSGACAACQCCCFFASMRCAAVMTSAKRSVVRINFNLARASVAMSCKSFAFDMHNSAICCRFRKDVGLLTGRLFFTVQIAAPPAKGTPPRDGSA